MSKVKILIVEDELLVAEEMAGYLRSQEYTVVEIVDSVAEAKKALNMYQIDIILIDIHLKGNEDGVNLANYIRDELPIPVIFTTSMIDDDTIKSALVSKPSAYLIKPYNYNELGVAIEMAMFNFENSLIAEYKESGTEIEGGRNYTFKQHFFVKDKNRFERVGYDEILWLKAESSYVSIQTIEKNYLLTSDTLGSLTKRMQWPNLLRTHRSYAINMDKVEALDGNQLCIGSHRIPIGKNYRSVVKQSFRFI